MGSFFTHMKIRYGRFMAVVSLFTPVSYTHLDVYKRQTQESGWNPRAISTKGAMGLMQLMPATAAEYGVQNPFDISENLSGGTRYLADLMQQLGGDFRLVLAAYYRGSRPILRRGLHYSDADVYAYVASVRRLYLAELALHNSPTNLAHGGDQ